MTGFTRMLLLTSALTAAGGAWAQEGEPIKIGVLHSLSGTMAISETTLKDTVLMLVEQQNAKGGVLGRPLEAVVVDPASDWPLFAEKARELLTVSDVDAIFGCWTSVSRKSVLPVIEELNGLLFYPVQYEGEESSKNVIYTGAAPNQQAIPAVDYMTEELGVEKWALLGTDYVYPRTTNNILDAYLKDNGVAEEDIFVNYTPFGHADWQNIVAEIKRFVTSICLAIGVLWEGTRGDSAVWEAVGALQVGNLKATAAKRRHRISRTFKRQLSFAARNAIGLGIQNPRQVLVGMAAVTRKGPTKQLTMKERKAQGKSDVCPTAKCEELQCWNYFLDSRTEPLSCCGAQPRSKDAKFSDWHGRGWPHLRNLTNGFLAQQTG